MGDPFELGIGTEIIGSSPDAPLTAVLFAAPTPVPVWFALLAVGLTAASAPNIEPPSEEFVPQPTCNARFSPTTYVACTRGIKRRAAPAWAMRRTVERNARIRTRYPTHAPGRRLPCTKASSWDSVATQLKPWRTNRWLEGTVHSAFAGPRVRHSYDACASYLMDVTLPRRRYSGWVSHHRSARLETQGPGEGETSDQEAELGKSLWTATAHLPTDQSKARSRWKRYRSTATVSDLTLPVHLVTTRVVPLP